MKGVLHTHISGLCLFAAFSVILPVVLSPISLLGQSERKSLLDTDPEVVYLNEVFEEPLELECIKAAPVFSDKEGKRRLGVLKVGQKVRLEAINDKVYRIRSIGFRDGISGWVGPWALKAKDPKFVDNLKQLYERQMVVQKMIEEHKVAIGMTMSEVAKSRGEPTKTTVRKTKDGQVGTWEYIDYEEVRNYINRVDPITGFNYRQLVSVTREEKGKTVIEFENDMVTALEESEHLKGGGALRTVVPPIIFGW